MATMTATTTMKTKAEAVVVEAWLQHAGGSGGSVVSVAAAAHWR
jgi:hypothetical protein